MRFMHSMQTISAEGAMALLKVSAADFQRNIGRYQDIALRSPVAVTRTGAKAAC